MPKPLIGEFMGTLILVLLGNGAVANVLLKKSKGEASGWIVITTGFGFAVMAGVFTAIAFGSPDAHINPAVTLGFAILTGDFGKLIPYTVAQILGAMVGATLVWAHYFPHWAVTPEPDLKLACFSTTPAIRNTAANLLSEVIGTFVLVLAIDTIFSKTVSPTGPVAGLGPYLVGAVVWSVGLSLGGHHRFCHKSGARSWTTSRAFAPSYRGEREFRLELCRGAGSWRFRRRSIGGLLNSSGPIEQEIIRGIASSPRGDVKSGMN